jgi:2-polyprenyl-6-methoxyphenol hydroxylase-like FAD-dependent oxidoreductase
MMTTPQPSVLIVGAGPTGLALAIWLAKSNIAVRIIDKNAKAGEASRAMIVHARILEYYQQLGIAERVIKQGRKVDQIQIRRDGKVLPPIPMGDVGAHLSPYPFILGLPQDEHELILTQVLAELGVKVEWSTELVEFNQNQAGVTANIRHNGVEQTLHCSYLCGCDGASSTVRHQLKLPFEGGTYQQVFYVADVLAANAEDYKSLSPCLHDNTFTLVFPLNKPNAIRLIGIVPPEHAQQQGLSFAAIQPYIESLTAVQVTHCNWFSTYHVHHRVAETFQKGRVFISGDAGHIHSPAGGQGMNTGLGDAFNLAWKLAAVLKGQAKPELLDTYNPERLAFAKVLVESTDTAFTWLVEADWHSWLVQKVLAPFVLPVALELDKVRRLMFKTVSQIRIEYHSSALSQGKAGELTAGDRLPWVKGLDNYDPLSTCDWQIHIYGIPTLDMLQAARSLNIALHEWEWRDEFYQQGLQPDTLYLIRPDGYIGLIDKQQSTSVLHHYWAQWHYF